MAPLYWLLLGAALALPACTGGDRGGAAALPTRQTTINPVNTGLDAAAQDAGRRRQDLDSAAK